MAHQHLAGETTEVPDVEPETEDLKRHAVQMHRVGGMASRCKDFVAIDVGL